MPLLRPPAPFVPWPFASLGATLPLLLGAGSWRGAAAEAALGSSPPQLNGTFVGDAGGSTGLAGTGSVPVSQGLCPPVMSSSSQGNVGMLWQGWDSGVSVVFLSLPAPWGPHGVPIPLQAPCSARSHPTRGTAFGRRAWGPGGCRVVAVADRTCPLQLSPVSPGCVSISKCPAARRVRQPWSAGQSQHWVPESLSWPLLAHLCCLGRAGSAWHSPGLRVRAGHSRPSCCSWAVAQPLCPITQ